MLASMSVNRAGSEGDNDVAVAVPRATDGSNCSRPRAPATDTAVGSKPLSVLMMAMTKLDFAPALAAAASTAARHGRAWETRHVGVDDSAPPLTSGRGVKDAPCRQPKVGSSTC